MEPDMCCPLTRRGDDSALKEVELRGPFAGYVPMDDWAEEMSDMSSSIRLAEPDKGDPPGCNSKMGTLDPIEEHNEEIADASERTDFADEGRLGGRVTVRGGVGTDLPPEAEGGRGGRDEGVPHRGECESRDLSAAGLPSATKLLLAPFNGLTMPTKSLRLTIGNDGASSAASVGDRIVGVDDLRAFLPGVDKCCGPFGWWAPNRPPGGEAACCSCCRTAAFSAASAATFGSSPNKAVSFFFFSCKLSWETTCHMRIADDAAAGAPTTPSAGCMALVGTTTAFFDDGAFRTAAFSWPRDSTKSKREIAPGGCLLPGELIVGITEVRWEVNGSMI